MNDRGIVKWRPFESVYSSTKILKKIHEEKDVLECPILSEDQLEILQDKIIESYELNKTINIDYFYNGKINKIIGNIKKINPIRNELIINNKVIYFKQIINVN